MEQRAKLPLARDDDKRLGNTMLEREVVVRARGHGTVGEAEGGDQSNRRKYLRGDLETNE